MREKGNVQLDKAVGIKKQWSSEVLPGCKESTGTGRRFKKAKAKYT